MEFKPNINAGLAKKHNCSQSYYYSNLINQSLAKSEEGKLIGHSRSEWMIRLKDHMFDSVKEKSDYMVQCFDQTRVVHELKQIIEYYRYYGQKPTIFS